MYLEQIGDRTFCIRNVAGFNCGTIAYRELNWWGYEIVDLRIDPCCRRKSMGKSATILLRDRLHEMHPRDMICAVVDADNTFWNKANTYMGFRPVAKFYSNKGPRILYVWNPAEQVYSKEGL